MKHSPIKYTFRNGRFELANHAGGAPLKDILKWVLSGDRSKWPKHVPNKDYLPPQVRVAGTMIAATWIGHSTVLLQTENFNILTDPFLSKRAGPSQLIGPARVRAPGIALKDLPPIDLILLSHSHYDHMDKPALRWLAKHHKATVITPLGNAKHTKGFNTVELDWHETHTHGHAKVTMLPALHWSKRTPSDTNKSLWGAFVVHLKGGAIYFAGDTGFGDGNTFREVNRLFGPPRLSLLPIGAYEPRWFMAPQHMNPREAVEAHQLLGSTCSLAIHHGTIQLTDENIDAPADALDEALIAANLTRQNFLVPDIGETVMIG